MGGGRVPAEGPGEGLHPGLSGEGKGSLPRGYWALRAPACVQLGLFGV